MAVAIRHEVDASVGRAIAHEYEAVPRSVRAARETVAEFAERHGASDEGVDDIRTAISEAATNAVVHAYDRETPGHFRVRAAVGASHISVTIEDDGCGLGAPVQAPGLGMGRHIIEESCEQARFFVREPGGSTVQLRFRLER